MSDNCNDCALVPRVEALEEANRNHSLVHEKMYDLIHETKEAGAVINARWEAVNDKLDGLTSMVKDLTDKLNEVEHKPAKRWDKLAETVLVAIVTGVVCFLLGRVGL